MAQLWKKAELAAQPAAVQPLYAVVPPPVTASPAEAPAPSAGPDGAEETVARHLRLLNRAAAELVQEQERLLAELRPELLRLVLALATEVIRRETKVDRSIVERTLQEALQQVHFATRVSVRVHPDDLAHLQAQPGLAEHFPVTLQWQADSEIELGGCRLHTDRGALDATIATQLRHLAEALQSTHS